MTERDRKKDRWMEKKIGRKRKKKKKGCYKKRRMDGFKARRKNRSKIKEMDG